MNKNILMSACALATVMFSGCATVADMAGADTATLNASAAQSYNQMVSEARAKNQLDTSSSVYKRVNSVFLRLKPYADQMNQRIINNFWILRLCADNDHRNCGCTTHGKKQRIKNGSRYVFLHPASPEI